MVASTKEESQMRFESAPTGGPRTVYAGYVLDDIDGETHIDSEYGVIAFESTTGRVLWRRPVCRYRPGLFAGGHGVAHPQPDPQLFLAAALLRRHRLLLHQRRRRRRHRRHLRPREVGDALPILLLRPRHPRRQPPVRRRRSRRPHQAARMDPPADALVQPAPPPRRRQPVRPAGRFAPDALHQPPRRQRPLELRQGHRRHR